MLGGQPIGTDVSEDKDDNALEPRTKRLVMKPTDDLTLTLREAVVCSLDAALAHLLQKLAMEPFRTSSASRTRLKVPVRCNMSVQAPEFRYSVVANSVDERDVVREADPSHGDDLAHFAYLTVLDQGKQMAAAAITLLLDERAMGEVCSAGSSLSGVTTSRGRAGGRISSAASEGGIVGRLRDRQATARRPW